MPHPFGELAIPSIEVGFESHSELWDQKPRSQEDIYPPWNDMLNEQSPSPYSMSAINTPTTQSPERSISSRKNSPKDSPKSSPRAPSSSAESEEERRKSRKREQNRESQRNFRRRQENRVKFLESRTLELEASSRQLRAENERLMSELHQAHQRNDEMLTMISLPNTPLSMPLEFEDDASSQSAGLSSYPPATMGMSMPFQLSEQQFFGPPAALHEPTHAGAW